MGKLSANWHIGNMIERAVLLALALFSTALLALGVVHAFTSTGIQGLFMIVSLVTVAWTGVLFPR